MDRGLQYKNLGIGWVSIGHRFWYRSDGQKLPNISVCQVYSVGRLRHFIVHQAAVYL